MIAFAHFIEVASLRELIYDDEWKIVKHITDVYVAVNAGVDTAHLKCAIIGHHFSDTLIMSVLITAELANRRLSCCIIFGFQRNYTYLINIYTNMHIEWSISGLENVLAFIVQQRCVVDFSIIFNENQLQKH